MTYKFKSKATGDTIMLGPNGDQMLRLLGREPAPKGIIEVAAMAAAIAALQAAVAADDAARAGRADADEGDGDEAVACARDPVSLRSRLWPMVDMLKRALAAGEPVVWGV
jgi:Domain of unknown function (DUF1840)